MTTFLVYAVVALLSGAPLLIVPGQMLAWLGWAPIDPLVSRVPGAALPALAWIYFLVRRESRGKTLHDDR